MNEIMQEWCDQYSLCYGCKFKDRQCIAPTSSVLFHQWQDEMGELILKEVATE